LPQRIAFKEVGMKEIILICLSIWIFSGLPGVATAGSDEAAIARTIMESADAATNFPQTKSYQKVFHFHTEDYSGIQDGVVHTRKMAEQLYREVGEMLKDGMPMTITLKVSNIRAVASSEMGWATYDEFTDIHSGELAMLKGDMKCTGLLRRIGSEWKIQHEHCSSTRDQTDKARKE
jgi:hypothetical protein